MVLHTVVAVGPLLPRLVCPLPEVPGWSHHPNKTTVPVAQRLLYSHPQGSAREA